MRKKILCILSSILILSSLIGCKSNNTATTSQPQTANSVKEFSKAEDLPATKTKYEYLGNNTNTEKDFKEDSNYNAITQLVDNFNKAMVEIDYTKEDTFFDYRNYISSDALKNQKNNIDDKVESTNFKDKKTQVEYVKTNIDNIVFNSYSSNYFVDCTYYSFVKNDPSVSEQNKYYQNKYYLLIIKENDKWVVSKWNGFSAVRAEDTPTTPTVYMLDLEKNKSVYLSEKELDKMKEMQDVKNMLETYFRNYYSVDYEKIDGFVENMLKYIANDAQKDMKELYEDTAKDVKTNKYKAEFKSIDFKVINYTSFDNTYWVTVNANYHINNQNIRTPIMIKLVKENSEWKIRNYFKMAVNLIVSEDN